MSGTVRILTYHRVNSLPNDNGGVRPDVFRKQLEIIRGEFQIIGLGELISLIREKRSIGEKPYVIITFDDGYKDNIEVAVPILKEFGAPACFFITAGYIGT